MSRPAKRSFDGSRSIVELEGTTEKELTAKERQKMQRLEMENAELRASIAQHMRVYSDCLVTICEMKAKLALVDSALHGESDAT